MSKLRAIVFDLDDTLYPEYSYVRSGFCAVAQWVEKALGIPSSETFTELLHLFLKGVRGNTFNRWLESRGICSKDLVCRMVQVYRNHPPQIRPYPEVEIILTNLRRTYKLGIVTDGHMAVQQKKLESLSIRHLFDAIVFSDELGRENWKPSHHPFKVVLERLGVSGFEAVYVGDNPQKDFLGAKQVGMRTIRVRCEEGLYSSLEPPSPEHAPNVEIKTLREIETALEQLLDEKYH